MFAQIDMIKPNVSELMTMVEECIGRSWVTRNKPAVADALQRLKAQWHAKADSADTPSGHANSSTGSHARAKVDITDVRILASALQGIMSAGNPATASTGRPNSKGSILTSEGVARKVRGKHVIVSMGSCGVLWVGPKESVTRSRAAVRHVPTPSNQTIIDIDDRTAARHFHGHVIDSENVGDACGAGDAFCAGVIGAMQLSECSELDALCIEKGMDCAHTAIIGNSV